MCNGGDVSSAVAGDHRRIDDGSCPTLRRAGKGAVYDR